jgi:hypothetical protein
LEKNNLPTQKPMSDDTPKVTPTEGKDELDQIETQRTQEQLESSLKSLMACEAVQAVRDDLNNWHQRRRAARITAAFKRWNTNLIQKHNG